MLGPLEVRGDRGQVLLVPGGRQRALLALLALDPGRVVSAERLIDDLWGAAAPQQPANALQIAVFKLRRVLGAERIETRPPGYALMIDVDDVDAYRFERLAGEARAAMAGGRGVDAVARFDEALQQWHGPALAEFGDVSTAVTAASRWDELRSSIVEDRFDVLLAMGRSAELVPDLDAAITEAPFRERRRGQLMLALYRSGRQADALRAFRDARHVLAEELGLDPSAELRRLEAAILEQDPSLDVAATTRVRVADAEVRVVPTNLRPALSSFVGRERDIVGISELLTDHRLVTLVGAGGCGKTRLATEFAAGHRDAYPDGVWLVPFDSLTTGDGVAAAAVAALGLSTTDGVGQSASAATGSVDRLRELLSDRTTLVVLDNCEHVIDDAAVLAEDLLASAPRLRLLATSREALRVPGETVWAVPPLDIEDAVALLVDRARSATADFELGEQDRDVATELCTRLDGMPLAIELTAARIRAFTVSQLAERLDDRFRLLTGGSRTALPRQQTLRAVTDWSYDLLFDDEKAVFERLSVFVGGCTLDAAEAVCSDDRVPVVEVGSLVGRLVDKSLLVTDGFGRYVLLQTLAQYGRERLAESGDGAAARDRHAEYFSRLVESSFTDWRWGSGRHSQVWWLERVTAELDNLRSALEWSTGCGDAVTAQRLAGHMGWYWWHAGRAVEGKRWLDQALTCPGSSSSAVRGRALAWAACCHYSAGDRASAASLATEATQLCEAVGDHIALGLAWIVRYWLAADGGDVEGALVSTDNAERACEMAGDPTSRANAAIIRSVAATLRGDHETGEREMVEGIDGFRTGGDVCSLVAMLVARSGMLQAVGRLHEAEVAAREGLEVSLANRPLRGWQSELNTRLGTLAALGGDGSRAVVHFQKAIEVARELALPAAEAAALDGLGLAHRRRGALDDAQRCHEAARDIADRVGQRASAAFSRAQLGYVAAERGDVDEAVRWLGSALALARELNDGGLILMAVEGLASAAAIAGDGTRAAALLGRAAVLRAGLAEASPVCVDAAQAEDRARELIGGVAFDEAWVTGQGSSLESLISADLQGA